MPIHNAEIAEMFNELADLLEVQQANPFRIRAYLVMLTLRQHKLQERARRWSKLMSRVVILGLGLVLLIAPEWLV